MSTLDFLFEGKPPKSVTTYGETIKDTPKWLSDYTQGLIARANAVAAEPYQPYGGPRIAGFDQDQQKAFELTRSGVGSYQPYLDAAAGQVGKAGQVDPLNAAQPYLDKGTGTFTGSNVTDYMDPYVDNVLDRQEQLATRTLNETFLPGLQKAFIGAGQFGSTGAGRSMEEIGVRGIRDISENLESQRLATLSDAYQKAGDRFNQDQTRSLQGGELAGQLSTATGELGLETAQQMGALADLQQGFNLKDAASLEAIGSAQQGMDQQSLDLAYNDFLQQRDLPMERTRYMSEILRGLPQSAIPSSTSTTQTGPASTYQPSGLAQLASAYGTYKGLTSKRGGLATWKEVKPFIEGEYERID
jgi:hypothetical protein